MSDEGVRKAMRRSDVARRLAAAVACCVLVLTACNGNPEPTVESPSPKPKKTAASATPTAPSPSASPGEPAEHTFIRHYIDLQNYARKTGDVEPMLAITSPKCQSCQGAADVIREVFEVGGHYEGDSDLRVVRFEGTGGAVLVVTRSDDYRVVTSAGETKDAYSGGQHVFDFKLQREGDRWRIREILASEE
ncbi:MAG: DUF6318 family protein [Actinopolymorphaceae bacterium]